MSYQHRILVSNTAWRMVYSSNQYRWSASRKTIRPIREPNWFNFYVFKIRLAHFPDTCTEGNFFFVFRFIFFPFVVPLSFLFFSFCLLIGYYQTPFQSIEMGRTLFCWNFLSKLHDSSYITSPFRKRVFNLLTLSITEINIWTLNRMTYIACLVQGTWF